MITHNTTTDAPRWEYGYFLNSGWGLFLSTQRTERGTVDDTTVNDFYGSADDAQAECDRRNTLTPNGKVAR